MSTRRARLARAAASTLVATFVAALSHAAAGGRFPPVALLVMIFGLSYLATLALTTTRLSITRLVVAVAVCQTAFHVVFSMSEGSSPAVFGGGHEAHALTVVASAAPHGHAGGPMLLAHVVAGVLTILALRYGETAFWGLVGAGRFVLARLGVGVLRLGVVRPPTPSMQVAGDGFRPRLTTLFLTSRQHRGPPLTARA